LKEQIKGFRSLFQKTCPPFVLKEIAMIEKL